MIFIKLKYFGIILLCSLLIPGIYAQTCECPLLLAPGALLGGSVMIYNENAPVGTVIEAYAAGGGDDCNTSTHDGIEIVATEGVYGLMAITGCFLYEEITFKINGMPASQIHYYDSGYINFNFNLSVDCTGKETNCADGYDNDCDGLKDCEDDDCAGEEGPQGVICCQDNYDCESCEECNINNICVYQADGSDVKDECPADSCNYGYCDGSGSCKIKPATTDCGTCAECDGSGNCIYDATQDGDCPLCQECSALGTCSNQQGGSDIKYECPEDACKYGYCDGSGSCKMKPATIDCGTCAECDGSGNCIYDATQDGDCGLCEECSGLGTCSNQPQGSDVKNECPADLCNYGYCDSLGSCAVMPTETDCGVCKICDGSGSCSQTPADDSYCGTIDCDKLDTICRDYNDLTSDRCEGFGDCKDPNTADCSSYTDSATGTDCGTCAECDGSGNCIYDATQDSDCPLCQECSALETCANQPQGEDVKDECPEDVCKYGYCDDAGACDMKPDTTDCDTCALCDAQGNCNVYDKTQDEDCSDTICPDACNLIPDDNPYTWDYADDVPNECTALFTCSQNQCDYSHECHDNDSNDGINGNLCGAECDQDEDCSATDCDYLDGCIGYDYYDYDYINNTCEADCSCTENQCGEPVVYENDPRCFRQWNIPLKKGWNLISSPLNFTNITEIFKPIEQYFVSMFSYEGKFIQIDPFNFTGDIDLRYGAWLRVSQNTTLTIAGKEFETTDIPLVKGWNLIGHPSLNGSLINETLKGINFSVVYAYNNSWLSYVPNRAFNSLQILKPGYGYWVYNS